MPKISVIVPVYNVEAYLPQCIDSIRKQTFTDIEIVCVNDGSTDRSGAILAAYAKLDSRVRAITIENSGVSHARNLGIELAQGEIVCFVDADDILQPKACQRIAEAFDTRQLDVFKFSAEPFPACCSIPWINDWLSLRDVVYETYSDELAFDEHTRPFPWNGAYRAQFLKDSGIKFPEDIALGEDQVFCFGMLARAHGVALSSEQLYRYRLSRKDSAMALAARDLADRVEKHIGVVGAVLDDWTAAGRMEGASARRMLLFVIDFLMPNICELTDNAARDHVLCLFRDALRSRFSAQDIENWLSGERILEWYKRVYDYAGDAVSFSGKAIYGYIAAMFGYREASRRRRRDFKDRLLARFRAWRRRHFAASADEMNGVLEAKRSMLEEEQLTSRAVALFHAELVARGVTIE